MYVCVCVYNIQQTYVHARTQVGNGEEDLKEACSALYVYDDVTYVYDDVTCVYEEEDLKEACSTLQKTYVHISKTYVHIHTQVGNGEEDLEEACSAIKAWRMGDAVDGLSAIVTRHAQPKP